MRKNINWNTRFGNLKTSSAHFEKDKLILHLANEDADIIVYPGIKQLVYEYTGDEL